MLLAPPWAEEAPEALSAPEAVREEVAGEERTPLPPRDDVGDDGSLPTGEASARGRCERPMRVKPDAASCAAIRALAAPRAAMPTSAHAPHCTLTAAEPCPRQQEASASRLVLAAE